MVLWAQSATDYYIRADGCEVDTAQTEGRWEGMPRWHSQTLAQFIWAKRPKRFDRCGHRRWNMDLHTFTANVPMLLGLATNNRDIRSARYIFKWRRAYFSIVSHYKGACCTWWLSEEEHSQWCLLHRDSASLRRSKKIRKKKQKNIKNNKERCVSFCTSVRQMLISHVLHNWEKTNHLFAHAEFNPLPRGKKKVLTPHGNCYFYLKCASVT